MTANNKIKVIVYFSVLYAVLKLLDSLGLLLEGMTLNFVKSFIDACIWSFLGYSLMYKRSKLTYWTTILFVSLLIIKTAMAGILLKISPSILSEISVTSEVLMIFVLVSAITTIIFLLQKEVRDVFQIK